MNAKQIALPLLSVLGLANVAARAEEAPISTAYAARVDPAAFSDRASDSRKLGVTASPATVRLITPGVDKFSIYNLIGPPHFDEGITRRWNYVLLFPTEPGGTERLRCRMEIRFGRDRKDGYNVTVSEVVWQDQACADRVAAAD
ncbi:hypothetical protein GCM10011494_05250 [Novosphingobium endophyticum]|uniref:Cell envelope protein SmpA n=1 Tax=Novosphingobium endophyticum TaxID=1955250 RepID=A0A916TP97_9SPHN|nr:outer membrane protein assembly factor BamE [Novosphingobium endophyticum]GGB89846.1 hypothetical protein GCM10011494_05250 [Novosphingobium endophyticum]